MGSVDRGGECNTISVGTVRDNFNPGDLLFVFAIENIGSVTGNQQWLEISRIPGGFGFLMAQYSTKIVRGNPVSAVGGLSLCKGRGALY